MVSRRAFFLGAGALVAAPSIVRASSLMPVKFVPEPWLVCDGRTLPPRLYPDLFRVVGFSYGTDSGGGFRLPDLRGFAPQPIAFMQNQVEHLISTSDRPGFPAGCINMRVNR